MKRGPKPIDVWKLRNEAYLFAFSLYVLRDGRPGLLRHTKPGAWMTRFLPELREDEVGRPDKVTQRILAGQMRYSPLRYRVTTLAVPPTNKARMDVLGLVRRNKNWSYTPPVPPRPEIWKRLKKARSSADVREIARRVRHHPELAAILYSHPEDFVRARQLHNYPKSKRAKSDDKRIQFFAKVLAGLRLGIAPATATKRLAHSCIPNSQMYRSTFEVMYSIRVGRRWFRLMELSNAH